MPTPARGRLPLPEARARHAGRSYGSLSSRGGRDLVRGESRDRPRGGQAGWNRIRLGRRLLQTQCFRDSLAFSAGVAAGHPSAKIGELIHTAGWAGMVRTDARGLWGKAEGQRNIELFQCGHLAVEPRFRIGTVAIGPAQAGAEMANAESS